MVRTPDILVGCFGLKLVYSAKMLPCRLGHTLTAERPLDGGWWQEDFAACPARLRLFWSQLHVSFVRSSSLRLLLITMLVMFSPSASASVCGSAVLLDPASWIQDPGSRHRLPLITR